MGKDNLNRRKQNIWENLIFLHQKRSYSEFIINFALIIDTINISLQCKRIKIMATLTLDNKIYQAYEAIAEQNNISVADVMKEALRILSHGKHLNKTTRVSVRKRLENRIEELRGLPSNWDYTGSPVISQLACDSASKILASCEDKLLNGLAVFPNINGGILMQWKTSKGDACLSILNDRIVYDVNCDNIEKEGSISLSNINAFLEILEDIA